MNHALRVSAFAAALCTIGTHADELSYTAVAIGAMAENWDDVDE